MVVGLAAGERAKVVVTDPGEHLGGERDLPGLAGSARGVVRVEQGGDHRVGPDLPGRVALLDRAQVPEPVSSTPGVQCPDQVGVAA